MARTAENRDGGRYRYADGDVSAAGVFHSRGGRCSQG